jgi:hypothetical protein
MVCAAHRSLVDWSHTPAAATHLSPKRRQSRIFVGREIARCQKLVHLGVRQASFDSQRPEPVSAHWRELNVMSKSNSAFLNRLVAGGSLAVLSACTHVAPLRVYPDDVPPDSLRLVQVIVVGTRSEILSAKEWYAALIDSGISDSEIQDGSMAVGRVWCCGGPAEQSGRQAFYVPWRLRVVPFDVVEIRAGREPSSGIGGKVNIATRVVKGANEDTRSCRWEPEDSRLWMRVLYCDWMPQEGWIELKTFPEHTWFKPPPERAP